MEPQILPTNLVSSYSGEIGCYSLICGIIVVTVLYFSWKLWSSPKHLPPGPLGWPWLGSPRFLGAHGFEEVLKLQEAYGEVTSFAVLGKTIVVCNSYRAIHEAAVSNRSKVGRYTATINHWLAQGYGISNYDTPRALELRAALLRHMYANEDMRAFLSDDWQKSVMASNVKRAVDDLLLELDRLNGEPVRAVSIMRRMVWKIIWKLVFGNACPLAERTIEHLMDRISENNSQNSLLQVKQLMPIFWIRLMNLLHLSDVKTMGERYTIVRTVLDAKTEEFLQSSPEQECLLKSFMQDSRLKMTVEEVKRMVFELLAAGTDTSSTTLTWACAILALKQKHFTGPITSDHMEHIYRWASVVPLGLPHIARRTITLRGYLIPEGSIVLFNLYSVHQSELRDAHNDTPAIPFSLGTRACPGERFARKLLQYIVTMIEQNFIIHDCSNAVPEQINPPNRMMGLAREPLNGLFSFERKPHTMNS